MLYLDMENTLPDQLPAFPPDLQVRPAPEGLARVAAFLTAAYPEHPVSEEDLQRLAAMRLPDETFRRVLLERGGEIVGLWEVGVPRMDGHAGWLSIEIAALPTEKALAEPLLAHAEAFASAQGAEVLISRVREGGWEKPFLEAHGYAEHDRMWVSVLDLRTLDFARFAEAEARAQTTGVQFRPLSDFGPFDEALQRRLYDLMAALLRDVPSTTPVSVWPFEVWQMRFASKLKYPEGLWLAVAPDGSWVGVSELHMPVTTRAGMLHNGLTGVLKPWRGHGLGLALKLVAARSALERGFTHSRTGNHSVNRPMLAINDQLGFEKEAATVTMKKSV